MLICVAGLPPDYRNRSRADAQSVRRINNLSIILVFIFVIFSCISIFAYKISGWPSTLLVPTHQLYKTFVFQTLRFLLLPTYLFLAARLRGPKTLGVCLNGLRFGLIASILFGALYQNAFFGERISSLSGEPRHLASFIVVYISANLVLVKTPTKLDKLFIVLLLWPLFLTSSYTGFAALALSLSSVPITSFLLDIASGRLKTSTLYSIIVLAILVIPLLSLFLIFNQREEIVGKYDQIRYLIDWAWGKDLVPIMYFLNFPSAWLTGFGAGGLNLVYTETAFRYGTEVAQQSRIFGELLSGKVDAYIAPSSGLIFLVVSYGFLPFSLMIQALSRSYQAGGEARGIMRQPTALIFLFPIFFFLGFHALLLMAFLIAVSDLKKLYDPFSTLAPQRF